MNDNILLALLKVDLGISTSAYDIRLASYIGAAEAAIEEEGITLSSDSMIDINLVVMYASWLWSSRDTGTGMPRRLRWMMNNRLFSEKVEASE